MASRSVPRGRGFFRSPAPVVLALVDISKMTGKCVEIVFCTPCKFYIEIETHTQYIKIYLFFFVPLPYFSEQQYFFLFLFFFFFFLVDVSLFCNDNFLNTRCAFGLSCDGHLGVWTIFSRLLRRAGDSGVCRQAALIGKARDRKLIALEVGQLLSRIDLDV